MNIQFSRQKPPVTIVPVNIDHLGARNEMIPTEYTPREKLIKRVGKHITIEHKTEFPNSNLAKETPIHPPYESRPTASQILQGTSLQTVTFPIIF